MPKVQIVFHFDIDPGNRCGQDINDQKVAENKLILDDMLKDHYKSILEFDEMVRFLLG